MRKLPLLVVGLTAPALLALAPLGATPSATPEAAPDPVQDTYEIRFAPTPGKAVTKTFTTTSDMALDDMEALMNGQRLPMGGGSQMDTSSSQVLKVTDEYVAASAGRVDRLARTYDSIDMAADTSLSMMGNASEIEARGTSELEGAAVVFTHNADTGEHDVAFKEGEDGDADLLDGLAVDLDLTALLPGEPLAIGGTYDIAPRAAAEILAPGGDLKLVVETDGGGGGMPGGDGNSMTDFQRYFRDVVEGEATGKLVEVIESAGSRIAIIELKFDVQADADLTEMMKELGKNGELPAGMQVEIDKQLVSMIYEAKGFLRWNITDGHLQGLELEADAAMEADMAMTVNEQMNMAMTMALSGTLVTTVSVE